ncbi:MAG: asparagine synthase (glutamine-hydrolyzing) [Fimbriimonadaceae bacterium]|nr:asparagine synthase (glutamine-hydrolyzing) [Chitinophagales bacterium]
MCGILGIVKARRYERADILQAFAFIKHRGSDHSGYHDDENIFLGNHRLVIQDISEKGSQPMYDASGRYIIIFNGEIYNHWEIRKQLQATGFQFNSTSDTETVLYGYIAYGEKILQKLNGIFAFSIYDNQKKEIFVARDQLGVKPLYYYFLDKTFIFCSEIKAIIKLPGIDKQINYPALTNYLQFLWSPGEMTPFSFVYKLLPGNYITCLVDDVQSTFSKVQYYQLPIDQIKQAKEKDVLQQLNETFSQSVDRQLLSDVPYGFFLSGGIDSSLVVSAARRLYPEKEMDCFTIKQNDELAPEGFTDDFNYAKMVADHTNVKLHVVDGNIDILKDFDKMIWHLDEPQADVAPLYVQNVCNAAIQNGIKVMLSGVGGDDLFSGYRRHQALFFDKYLQYVPGFMMQWVGDALQKRNFQNPSVRRISKLLKHSSFEKLHRIVGYFEWFPVKEHLNLFTLDVQQTLIDYDPDEYLFRLLKQLPEDTDTLNKMLFLDLKTFLVDHNLNYTDKMGMACGVEVRVPFLDLELVNFAMHLPVKYKMKGLTTKYLLRQLSKKYLPDEIVHRSKTGFGAPVRKWIMHDLDEMIYERLNPKLLREQGIFQFDSVLKLIKDNKDAKIDASYTILTILAIQSWMEQFANGSH